MYPEGFKKGFISLFDPAIGFFVSLRIRPNWLTTAGFAFGVASGFLFATGHFLWGGLVAFLSAACDAVDGSLARRSGAATTFGRFYDSFLDRYSELAMFIGLSYYYAGGDMWRMVILTDLALVGSLMVSYARARAEGLGLDCKVGLMERPERLTVVIAGTILTGMFDRHWIFEIALWVLAVLTNLTALQRMLHVRKLTAGGKGA
ncbi:MAG TPA: CDP-alcohol phosphatidyltransferase family protein [candidate division Zixibacteria bacterium]|nr:CDP-alcohol phosphatidyltransferase family protein [candidate division Zixibacteria bacterium]